jgi:alkanesulfonate monooxygenase SsuD/methylene tetrahydromethanopterin reductase-like flavin-dependent oxidoreductase (luciferase family)
LRKLGKDPEQKAAAINRIVHVLPDGTSRQSALEFFGKRFLRLYDAWGHQNVTELGAAARLPSQIDVDHFIIGEPAECVDRIARYAALGIGEIACLMNFGRPEAEMVERSMRLFADRVMPHVGAH